MIDLLLKKKSEAKYSSVVWVTLKKAALFYLLIFPPGRKRWQKTAAPITYPENKPTVKWSEGADIGGLVNILNQRLLVCLLPTGCTLDRHDTSAA